MPEIHTVSDMERQRDPHCGKLPQRGSLFFCVSLCTARHISDIIYIIYNER